MKLWGILSALAVLLVLSVGISDFPFFGDPGQPSALHVVPRYVERTVEETGVPNVVTSIHRDLHRWHCGDHAPWRPRGWENAGKI